MDVYNKYVVYYSETLVLYLTYSIFYLCLIVYIWVFGGLYSIYIYIQHLVCDYQLILTTKQIVVLIYNSFQVTSHMHVIRVYVDLSYTYIAVNSSVKTISPTLTQN